MNNKRPSKPSLPYVLEPSKLLVPTDLTKPCLLQLSELCNSARLHPPNKWLLPMLPSSTKTSLSTQDGCGKCLGYQPLKDLDMESQELRKITMDCVEDYGYENLSLSRVMTRVFSLKSTPLNMWVMMVYIVWVKTQWSRYAKIAKQNVLCVSCRKALPAKYLRRPAVMTLSIPVMCLAHGFTSQEVFLRAICENSFDL